MMKHLGKLPIRIRLALSQFGIVAVASLSLYAASFTVTPTAFADSGFTGPAGPTPPPGLFLIGSNGALVGPTDPDFGSVPVGQAVTLGNVAPSGASFAGQPILQNAPFAISNGEVGVSISSVSIQGSPDFTFAQDTCLGATLPFSADFRIVPFAECWVFVTFTPSASGFHQAVLTISGEELGANGVIRPLSVSIALTGTGVGIQYKLIAYLAGNQTPIPDSGGSLTLPPSTHPCGKLTESEEGDTDVRVDCVDASAPTVHVDGCQFMLHLSQGQNIGGHNHNLGDGTRPFILNSAPPLVLPPASFPVDKLLLVDSVGDALNYPPPEVSGDVSLNITGLDPHGNAISGPSYTFHVQSNESLPSQGLGSLDGAGASAGNPGISIVTASHSGLGIFGTSDMRGAVSDLVINYYLNAAVDLTNSPHQLESQAATMILGGLFDANWNGDVYHNFLTPWEPPHCGHRNGATIDLSLSQLNASERKWLQQAAVDAGLEFKSPGERPQDTAAKHWHATLKSSP